MLPTTKADGRHSTISSDVQRTFEIVNIPARTSPLVVILRNSATNATTGLAIKPTTQSGSGGNLCERLSVGVNLGRLCLGTIVDQSRPQAGHCGATLVGKPTRRRSSTGTPDRAPGVKRVPRRALTFKRLLPFAGRISILSIVQMIRSTTFRPASQLSQILHLSRRCAPPHLASIRDTLSKRNLLNNNILSPLALRWTTGSYLRTMATQLVFKNGH